MKKLHFFLFVAVMACFLVGCRKPIEVSFGVQSQTIAADGGSCTVELNSNGEWSINTTAEWLTVSPTSGNGDVTLTLVAQPNTTQQVRSTEIQATTKDNTATLTVSQEFVPVVHPEEHYLTITPTEVEVAYTGGSTTIDLECDEDWTVDIGADWTSLDKMEGNGNGQIVMTVTENTSFTERHTEIKFVSASHCVALLVVTQEGAPDSHYLEVTPRSITFGKEGGTDEFTVQTDEDWQASCDGTWVSLSTESGSGNGNIVVTVEPNEINEARQARLRVVSRNLTKTVFVTQEPGDNPYMAAIEPDTVFVGFAGGARSMTITSNCDWTIEAPSWVTLPTTSGTGDAVIDIMVGYNSLFTTRTGFIMVKRNGQLMASTVVVQEGRENILTTDVTEITMPAEGGARTFNITANQSWVIRPMAEWIQCTPGEGGTGETEVTMKVIEWHGTEPREAEVIIYGDFGAMVTILVHQNP